MPDKDEKQAPRQAEKQNEAVQQKVDEAEDKGYFGRVPDPTPNENYSLETGPEAPTPETDPDLARQVGSRKFDKPEEQA